MSMSGCKECITNKVWIQFLPDNFLHKCIVCNQKGIRQTRTIVYGRFFAIIMYLVFFFLAYYMFVS